GAQLGRAVAVDVQRLEVPQVRGASQGQRSGVADLVAVQLQAGQPGQVGRGGQGGCAGVADLVVDQAQLAQPAQVAGADQLSGQLVALDHAVEVQLGQRRPARDLDPGPDFLAAETLEHVQGAQAGQVR